MKRQSQALFRIGAACAALLIGSAAQAQISGNVVKIGVMGDMNGMYSGSGGPGTVLGVRMAIEDFGGTVNGKKIEVVVADDQNKPNVGINLAREWIERDSVDTIVMGSISSIALSVSGMMKEHKKPFLIAGSGSADLTGKACSPMNFQFVFDTYMLAKGGIQSLLSQGIKTFYFVTVDYTFGKALQDEATRFIEAAGGKVVGSIRHPLGATDFSSYLLQAQSSKAQAIVMLNAGLDTSNAMKQAAEYRVTKDGQILSVFGMTINTVVAMGLETAQGLQITETFYWDRNDETRAWSKRFMARNKGVLPSQHMAGAYSAVTHYLKAISAAGTDEGTAVVAKMKATRVNDFQMKDIPIREDGQVMRPTYSIKVKTPAESKNKDDLYKIVGELPADQVWRPLAEGGCDFVKAK